MAERTPSGRMGQQVHDYKLKMPGRVAKAIKKGGPAYDTRDNTPHKQASDHLHAVAKKHGITVKRFHRDMTGHYAHLHPNQDKGKVHAMLTDYEKTVGKAVKESATNMRNLKLINKIKKSGVVKQGSMKKEGVKSADKKPEMYTKPDGKRAVRMVSVDKEVIKDNKKMNEGAKEKALKGLMTKALGGKRAKPGYTSAVANNGDFVVKDGSGRIVGRIKKGDFKNPLSEVLDTPKAMQSYRDKNKRSKEKAANSAAAKILRGPDKDGKRADHSPELNTMRKRRDGEKMVDRLAGRKTLAMIRKQGMKEGLEEAQIISKKPHPDGGHIVKLRTDGGQVVTRHLKNGKVKTMKVHNEAKVDELSMSLKDISKSGINKKGHGDKDKLKKDLDKLKKGLNKEAYNEPQGQAKRMMSPLQKMRMDKEKADRDRDGKLKPGVTKKKEATIPPGKTIMTKKPDLTRNDADKLAKIRQMLDKEKKK